MMNTPSPKPHPPVDSRGGRPGRRSETLPAGLAQEMDGRLAGMRLPADRLK